MDESNDFQKMLRGNNAIAEEILGKNIFFIGRFGSVEARILTNVELSTQSNGFLSKFISSIRLRKEAWINAGIWPPTSKQLEEFLDVYAESLSFVTTMATWENPQSVPDEKFLLEKYKITQRRITLSSLDAIQVAANEIDPWTLKLESRNVLVISTFADLISDQYLFYRNLHNSRILPKFNLQTMRPPQTNGISFSRFTWKQNLEKFKADLFEKIKEEKPQIALVAAGAYGMPICSYLYKSGISVIYVGGALQLLFGIMGKRWEQNSQVLKISTSLWVKPPAKVAPRGFRLIENGTYW